MFLNGDNTLIQQLIRFVQLIGIPLFGVLLIIGLLILLTAGKNPQRKQYGFRMTIIFTIGLLAIAYVPLISTVLLGEGPNRSNNVKPITELVNSSTIIGDGLFGAIQLIAIPITFNMMIVGILIKLLAVKSPQRKRLGLGLMLFSPLVLIIVFILPTLLTKL